MFALFSIFLCTIPSFAGTAQDTQNFLTQFQKSPKTVMQQIPVKKDAHGNIIKKSESLFSAEQIASKSYITDRDQARQKICTVKDGARVCLGEVLPGKSAFESNDLVENLVDDTSNIQRNIVLMDNKQLTSGTTAVAPWSGYYWAVSRGLTAIRYADDSFPQNDDWQASKNYYDANNYFTALYNSRTSGQPNPISVDTLSPAEKYDLLVGSSNSALTQSQWAEGQQYFDQSGSVESWMGICHGWSPAAYELPRPTHPVNVTAVNGTQITFYPDDIKALGSLLWANSNPNSRFVGGRCNDKDPATDANGRLTSQDCFDTNPGTWHMSIVNQLGINKKSFVMDATYDYEVWNQPVLSYSYSYFNPQTMTAVPTMNQGFVRFDAFTNDKFKAYRNSGAVFAIGVAMNVTYVRETYPTHQSVDSVASDASTTVTYYYDLELDLHGNILGGEWYQNAHPDFMWTPVNNHASSVGDQYLSGSWNPSTAFPASWSGVADEASSQGQPLAGVVDALFNLAK